MTANSSLVEERDEYVLLLKECLGELGPGVLRLQIVGALASWLKRHDVYGDHGPRICPGCDLSWESPRETAPPVHGRGGDEMIQCVLSHYRINRGSGGGDD